MIYLSATTHSIVAVTDGAATTDEPQYVASFQDITSAGMTMPMSSGHGDMTGATEVTIIAAPGASTTRQLKEFSICNIDTVSHTVTVYKDVSGTNYQIVQAILESGDTLVYNDNNSWSIFTAAGTVAYTITEFIANGTWTKPAGLKAAFVFAVGAGGGGGSGRRGAAGTNRFGGGGGGGGASVQRIFTAAELGASYAVTVGTGGTGGTGIAVDDTSGNAGTDGGVTTFGAAISARYGAGGGGGTAAAGAAGQGGVTNLCIPTYGPYASNAPSGGSGQTINASPGSSSFAGGGTGSPSGAGGGGINSANTSSTAAYTGGGLYNNGILINGGLFGANGVDNAALSVLFHPSLVGSYGVGTGAGGGRPGTIDGGDGGLYGTGGGGGSGVLNGGVSGAGGNGAGGLVVVLEIF